MVKLTFKQVLQYSLDDPVKENNKLNRNYYFVSTIFFILLNIIIFAAFGSSLVGKFMVETQNWGSVLNFKGLFSALINNISHWDWNHVLLNMFPTFFIISIYLERKFGSLKHFLLVCLSIVVSAAFVSGNHQSLNYAGWSCVNFALMAFFIVSFFVSLNKEKRINGNLIYGTITFVAVFIFMWWEIWEFIGASSAADLIHNMGHYSGFVSGLIIGATIYLTKFFCQKGQPKLEKAEGTTINKSNKIVITICLSIISILCISTIIMCIVIH